MRVLILVSFLVFAINFNFTGFNNNIDNNINNSGNNIPVNTVSVIINK